MIDLTDSPELTDAPGNMDEVIDLSADPDVKIVGVNAPSRSQSQQTLSHASSLDVEVVGITPSVSMIRRSQNSQSLIDLTQQLQQAETSKPSVVVDSPALNAVCPLCTCPIEKPTATLCGHLFCWQCIVDCWFSFAFDTSS